MRKMIFLVTLHITGTKNLKKNCNRLNNNDHKRKGMGAQMKIYIKLG